MQPETAIDFEKQHMSYFYANIFYDIFKNRDGKVEFSVKYSITLDKENYKEICEKTNIFYE